MEGFEEDDVSFGTGMIYRFQLLRNSVLSTCYKGIITALYRWVDISYMIYFFKNNAFHLNILESIQ